MPLLEKVISFINLFLFPLKKILNSKATECRSLLFIPGPVCCCRIQEWVLLPIFDIGHCSAAVQGCSGAGVTAPHLTPPSLWAKIEQPLEETLMRCTTERCSCCSVGCKYNHHLSMYKLSPHLLRTLWSQPVTPWCCSAAVLQCCSLPRQPPHSHKHPTLTPDWLQLPAHTTHCGQDSVDFRLHTMRITVS